MVYRNRECVRFPNLLEAEKASKIYSKFFGALCCVWEDKERFRELRAKDQEYISFRKKKVHESRQ